MDIKILEDIICRFIINNPDNFKNNYKLFFNMQNGFNYVENYINKNNKTSFKDFCYEILKILNYKLDVFNKLYSSYIKKLNNIPIFGVIFVKKDFESIMILKEKINSVWNFPCIKQIESDNIKSYMTKVLSEDLGIDINLNDYEEDFLVTNYKKNILNKYLFIWNYDDEKNKNIIYNNKKNNNLIKWENINSLWEKIKNNNLYENIKPLLNSIKDNLNNKKNIMKKKIEEIKEEKLKNKTKEEYKYSKMKFMTSVNISLINFDSKLEDIGKNYNKFDIFKNNEFDKNLKENPLINFKI